MSPHRPVTVKRRRRRPGRWLLLGAPLAFLAVIVGYAAWMTFTPTKGEGSGAVRVVVPQGASTREIGDLLADKGVVGSGLFFALRAGIGGDDLRAGRYTLRQDMGNSEAIDALTRVPVAPKLIRLTLPEGPSRRELAQRVSAAGVEGDYVSATQRSPRLRPRDYGAPKSASLEGFLFPATYELKPGASTPLAGRAAGRGLQGQPRLDRPSPRQAQEPDPLRRPDDRLDDRARDRAPA